ncbi:hypothetical protein J31TS4_14200 [Paenibacillus sp. J31TS4]|uniref:protein-glutamine gamma-glutamyltransferase n=1 Tax=Paenibacillus sp. J31TS4 TaxID=2807195 RepID=UPI001B0FC5F0|nr:protein-glutamine gamma-glutamyltransferase [Paenibacillus sp. J31TS4]GIP38140.1 hypothetical protein J31TS4_14200 [Paenibacillus sp. J31TS4]
MIVISGSQPFDPAGLPEEELSLYRLKDQSPVRYQYSSVGELRFELGMRAAIQQAARDLNASGAAFATFRTSRCNPAYWERTPEGAFRLRSDVTPADGIRDIFRNGHLYAFECATAMVICLYRGALAQMGDEAFNRHFADLELYDWHYDSDLRLTTLPERKEAYPGDILYFVNPDVSPATPWWQGENGILLDADLYYGHGVGIKSAQGIIDSLNKHRRPNSSQSAYLKDQVSFPDYTYLYGLSTGAGPGSGPSPRSWMQARRGWAAAQIGSRGLLQLG